MRHTDIPLVDLRLAHRRVADSARDALEEVLETSSYILGPAVDRFEGAYAEYCEVAHCIGVANGTDAIELVLRACGLGAGDEVIVPANTFIATVEAVMRSGATPVFADVTDDYLIDPKSVAAAMTPGTRAVIGVHLYGQMAPMEQIADVVGPDVLLIEDAAQSQGARRHGRRSGSVGLAAATSFYPGKNLGGYGDAGGVTTRDPAIAARVRAMRNHGGVRKYEHREFGMNSRLDSLQAAVLAVKLEVLDAWNDERREAAVRYGELLRDVPWLSLPSTAEDNEHVWHLYVVECEQRDRLLVHLNEAGVGAAIHYPVSAHLQPSVRHLGYAAGTFPVAEAQAERILSLPIFPGITEDQQVRVAEMIRGLP